MTICAEQLKKAKPDLAVLKEYKQREEEFLNRAKDLDKITDERNVQKEAYERLRKQRHDEFMDGFRQITQKVKEMYQVCSNLSRGALIQNLPVYR